MTESFDASALPLVLAGPILRRVDPPRPTSTEETEGTGSGSDGDATPDDNDSAAEETGSTSDDGPASVTVWIALREARTVGLTVLEDGKQRLTADPVETVPLGENLHVVAVTANERVGEADLAPGVVYSYDLEFTNGATTASLDDVLEGGIDTVTYGKEQRPTFSLPPPDPGDLRIAHASCRKAHGPGADALPAVHEMIRWTFDDANARPHQLFLTGDQIYADDVADALLAHVVQVGPGLLGRTESFRTDDGEKDLADMPPGSRAPFVEEECGFTSGHARNHLFGLGEYYALYLLAWSEALWPEDLPGPGEVLPDEHATAMRYIDELRPGSGFEEVRWWVTQQDLLGDVTATLSATKRTGDLVKFSDAVEALQRFTEERDRVESFRDDVGHVRRAIANVPTYMIFDDHEVTDDWFLRGKWCKRVVRKPMGRQVLRNAMAAYAVCQAWGNTPEQFEPGANGERPKGRQLLNALDTESPEPTDDERSALDDLLGIPSMVTGDDGPRLESPSDPIDWHYTVRGTTSEVTGAAGHEVLVLDTRTRRGFDPDDDHAPPEILREDAFEPQLPETGDVGVTIVVSAVPVWTVPLVDFAQELRYGTDDPGGDPEHWRLQHEALERLLARLATRIPGNGETGRSRVVLLSGDVHHGFSSRTQYWAEEPFEQSAPDRSELVVASLVASAAKNQEWKTELLHGLGYHAGWILTLPLFPAVLLAEQGLEWLFDEDLDVSLLPRTPLMAAYPLAKAREGMPEEVVFGWNVKEPGLRHPYGITERDPPLFRDSGEFGDRYDLTPAPRPDWYYRVDYVDAETYHGGDSDPPLPEGDLPPVDDIPIPRHGGDTEGRSTALGAYLERTDFWYGATFNDDAGPSDRSGEYGFGSEIVGVNNVGEVAFEWGREGTEDAGRRVVHALWWRLAGDDGPLPPFPLSKYVVSLDFDDEAHPRPEVIAGP